MKKYCVFCGKRPQAKNMEHVLPQWLMSLTGDPSRNIQLGFDWQHGKRFREYALNQLKFPACRDCNTTFSSLEGRVKEIMVKILAEQALSGKDLCALLGWFDKVRIGLWLGYLLLNKGVFGIDPRFHIITRMDQADRMLLIYKTSDKHQMLQFSGPDNPFFYWQPSCFRLVVNQYCFINVSNDFLFSRRLGLPFAVDTTWRDDGRQYGRLVEGKKRILYPLIRMHYDKTCTQIFQPMIRSELLNEPVYSDGYVRKYCGLKLGNKGEILINFRNKIVEYGGKSKRWVPEIAHSRTSFIILSLETLIAFQELLITDMPRYDKLPYEKRKHLKMGLSLHRKYTKMVREKIKDIGLIW